MKALSIKQPWAWLIVMGYKDVENRTWEINKGTFNMELPKRIYVHASKSFDYKGLAWLMDENSSFVWPEGELYYDAYMGLLEKYKYDLGAIVGEVDIIECVTDSSSAWAESGLYQFVLSNPVCYDSPVAYTGMLGMFEPVFKI